MTASNEGRRGNPPVDDDRPGAIDVASERVSTLVVQRRPVTDTVALDVDRGQAPFSVGIATSTQLNAFRELRTRLLAMASAIGRSYFTTLVVATTPGSGASFVARNLAVAFTLQEHQLAILVDCNLGHPMQHRALGTATDEGGLFEFLERPQGNIEHLVRPTPIPGLHLIPAGRTPTLPREYFSSQ